MKKLAFLGGAVVVGALALSQGSLTSHAADHLDGGAIAMTANRMADLNDVYAWMTTDAAKVNLALTVSPADNGTRSFSPSVVYAFHLTSRSQFGAPGQESKIICKFASDTDGECFVVDPAGKTVDYVKGDFTATAGKASKGGGLRVFAGRRADPFFFNLAGYATARAQAETACGGSCPPPTPPSDAAKCPPLIKAQGIALRDILKTAPTTANQAGTPCAANQIDCFANFNVMAIVVQLDKTLVLNGDDKLVTVWASTHMGS